MMPGSEGKGSKPSSCSVTYRGESDRPYKSARSKVARLSGRIARTAVILQEDSVYLHYKTRYDLNTKAFLCLAKLRFAVEGEREAVETRA